MERVARPAVDVPARIVRTAIADTLPGVVVTPALASALRAALESVASEWIAAAALCARGIALRPQHLLLARDSDAGLQQTFPGAIPHVGGARGDTALAFALALEIRK
jgi:hypothetical protein